MQSNCSFEVVNVFQKNFFIDIACELTFGLFQHLPGQPVQMMTQRV